MKPDLPDKVDAIPPNNAADGESAICQADPVLPHHIPKPPTQKTQTHYCKPDQTPAWEIVVACLAVIVGLGAIVVYLMQLSVMRRQLDDTERATNDATQTQTLSNMPLILTTSVNPMFYERGDGSKGIKIQQVWSEIGETRAVGPIFEWGWGNRIPDSRTIYQRQNDRWKSTTWVKGFPQQDEAEMPDARSFAESQIPLYV